MRIGIRSWLSGIVLAYVMTLASAQAGTLTAEEVMTQNLNASKVKSSVADTTIRLINSNGQTRVRETQTFTKLIGGTNDNMRMVNFRSPADVKGTKTLWIEHSGKEDDIWVYLPALKKVRRLVASNKKDSFAGTDFSHGDIVGQKVSEWKYKVLKEEEFATRNCYVIEALAKNSEVIENSGYSKRVVWVDKVSFLTIKAEIYDSGGALLKIISASNLVEVDPKAHKWQAMKIEALNKQTEHKTIIETSNFKIDVGVSNDIFTPQSLEK